ncbi:protein kinase domain-containing protein [Streptomyces griseochromogenes]|uniref:serine/threonine-protein kinase n=1 Tax=Streptomyces griseochromogenes TaxID=68214 RepID=UPI00378EB611
MVDADPRAETPWFATEYVLGPPLDDAVELCGPLPEASVRALGAALCAALGQLHASDVVHRDLKPSNILITAYGPKVIDFGIARAAGDDHLTRVGAAVGTPAFMSPEQASGQEHTAAGDVFALAGLLVFAAAGRPPFGHGQAADLLYRVQYAEPDLTGVPGSLVPLIARCLDKNPFRRPTTSQLAAELHDGAGEFADHLPPALLADIARRATEVWQIIPQRSAAPPEEAEPAAPAPVARVSRRRLLLTGGGAALAVAGAGAGAWAWNERGGAGPKPQASPGPSNSLLPRRKLDSLWQIQVADPPDDTVPAQLHTVGDLVTLVAGKGLGGIVAENGHVQFASDQMEMENTWQVASDGERLIRLVQAEGSEGNAGKPGGFPLLLASVDLLTGKASQPFAQFTDFNGVIYENQLVCTADGVAYVAAGRGKFSDEGFLASQSWFLFAVDIDSGKRVWTTPLPARRQGSERLYFLSAAVVGRHLVTLQEANDGTVRAVVRGTRTGAARWDRPLDGVKPDPARQPLAVDAQHLYVGNGSLRALRLSDGGVAWDTRSGRPSAIYGPPLVKDGTVYAAEKGHGLVALTDDRGIEMWREKGGQGTKADVTAPPVIGPNYVYNKRGSELWGIAWHATFAPARSLKTTGDRFIAHEKSKRIIALGGKFLAAFPLQ